MTSTQSRSSRSFKPFFQIVAAFILGLVLLAAYARPESVVKSFKTVNGSVHALIGFVFAWKPQAMHFIARFLGGVDWITWIVTGVVLTAGVFIIGKAITKL